MDRCPYRRIVDNATEVRHLQFLQPVRQHQCLVTRELDRDLAIAHAHPYRSAPPSTTRTYWPSTLTKHIGAPPPDSALRVLADHNRVTPLESMGPQPCAGVYTQVPRPGLIKLGDLVC